MACHPLPGGGFACGPRQRVANCETPGCTREHVALCDWPLEGPAAGRTCDKKMCGEHRNKVAPNKDYCAPHHRAHLAKQGSLL